MSAFEPIKQEPGKPDMARAQEPSMEEILASIRRIIADDQTPTDRATEGNPLRAGLDMPRDEPLAEVPVPAVGPPDPPRRTGAGQAATPFRYTSPNLVSPVAVVTSAANLVSPSFTTRNEASSAPVSSAPVKSEYPVPHPEVVSRLTVPSSPIGQIAAPQFAMPDTPMMRGVAQQQRGAAASDPSLSRLAAQAEHPTNAPDTISGKPEPASTGGADVSPEPANDPTAGLFSSATDHSITSAFAMLAASRLVENDAAIQDMVRDMIRPLLKHWIDDNLPSMVERLVRAEIERVGRGGR